MGFFASLRMTETAGQNDRNGGAVNFVDSRLGGARKTAAYSHYVLVPPKDKHRKAGRSRSARIISRSAQFVSREQHTVLFAERATHPFPLRGSLFAPHYQGRGSPPKI